MRTSEGSAHHPRRGGDHDSCHAIAVVTVNYGTPADVEVLVRSLARQKGVILHCVCVDITGDVDDVRCAGLMKEAGFTWRVIRSENVGYGSAGNAGLRLARESWGARWAIVTNPDIEIADPHAVLRLQQALIDQREAGVWLVGPRVVTPDGRDQSPYRVADMSPREVRVETAKHVWPVVSHTFHGLQVARYAFRSLRVPVPRTFVTDVSDHADTGRVFAVHGCFFMVDLEPMIAGGIFPLFDEGMFLYCEEIAVAKRIQLAGGAEAYVPSVQVIHAEDASNRSRPPTRTLVKTMRQHYRSRRHIMGEYYRGTGV